jgi:hypothetical protein
LKIGIGDLLKLVAAALGCLNFVNEIVIEANKNGSQLRPDASQTIDNLFFPLPTPQSPVAEEEGDFTNHNARATTKSFVTDLMQNSSTSQEPHPLPVSDLVLSNWIETRLGLTPNSAALFVSQTVLRNDEQSGIYYPSQKFPGGNARNVDMNRIFCASHITVNKNPGILGTLYGLVGPAFESYSVTDMPYVVWPYIIFCENDTAKVDTKPKIAVRTPFAHAQQDKIETEPEKVFASHLESQNLVHLINLLNMASAKKCLFLLFSVFDLTINLFSGTDR